MTALRWMPALVAGALLLQGCEKTIERAHGGVESSVSIEARPPGRTGGAAGDPVNGARLYQVHCSSCHGATGDGDGPAARFVYPPPRAHTDPSHMNRRTDQELHDVIAAGGSTLGLSSLMPRWDDVFGGHQIWDLVAHVRTLHQPLATLVDDHAGLEPHEVVLSDEALARVARATGDTIDAARRRVTFFAPSEAAAAPESSAALVAFGSCRLAGLDIKIGISVDASFRLIHARTFPLVVVHHRGFTLHRAVDSLLASFSGSDARSLTVPPDVADDQAAVAGPLVAAVRRLALELEAARRQEDDDRREAAARLALHRKEPAKLAAGERDYMMACASCHGPTGKGAPVTSFPGLRSRNLSDGAHLNRRTDAELAFVIAQGGERARLSSAMPGFGSVFDERRIGEIVAFVRTLARPRREASRAP